jgi:hypothetical protein
MRAVQWFQEKWVDRVRQFGLFASFAQALRAAVRPVWRINHDLILAILDHKPNEQPVYPEIIDMTAEKIEAAVNRGELTGQQKTSLYNFLAEGCRGFIAEVNGRLAGYAFIQPAGTYTITDTSRMQIPAGMMILKNLLVFPEFRGHSLGKKLNQARIAAIPADQTPIVFVIMENRFAIRNLMMFGFEEILIVTKVTWFGKRSVQRIKVLRDCEISRRLIDVLESADHHTNADK